MIGAVQINVYKRGDSIFNMFRADIPSIFKVMGFKEELEKNLCYFVDVVTLPITQKKLNIDKVINVYERAR